jgi:NAD(P)-dependent dehydrogenase (short-subunit alcohol dehydrogenase family)
VNDNNDQDDDAGECHRQAAALYAALLISDTEEEAQTAVRQIADGIGTYVQMLIIGAMAGTIQDLLDDMWERDDPERLEWIAHRTDIIAKTP